MKILFINVRYDETKYRYRVNKLCPPLGMAYIASILRNEGHDVKILDMEAIRMEYEELPEYLSVESPDLVGIHGTTPTAHFIARCVDITKETCPDATVVVGGAHVSLLPEDALNDMPGIDYIFRGEAEYSMRDLVRCLGNGSVEKIKEIPGIGFRQGDQLFISPEITVIEDLDSLPLPAYDLLPLDAYFYGTRLVETGTEERIFTIMSSRGCPHSCIFCCAPTLYGNKYRSRSPKNVVDEMEVLMNEYGISHIVFYDASFMANVKRVEGICREILDRGLKVTWRARVRADKVSEPIVKLMKKAGCTTLAIGVETGSQRLLDVLNKKTKLADIENAFRIVKDVGMWTVGYFILGVPTETLDDTKRTIEFAKKLDPDWALFTHATPLPGTKLYEMVRDDMLFEDWSRHKFSANSPIFSYDGLTLEEMQEVMENAFSEYYLREEWLMNRLRKVTNPVQMERIVESFFDYLNKELKSRKKVEVSV